MTTTLNLKLTLQPDEQARLEAQAQQQGLTLEAYVQALIERLARPLDARSLCALPRDERNRLLSEQAEEAVPLYGADLARPVEERELTAFTALDGDPIYERTPCPPARRGLARGPGTDPSAEISKARSYVVLNATGIGRLPLRIIISITEWDARYAGYVWMIRLRPDTTNGLSKTSTADTFHIRSVSLDRFLDRVGVLSNDLTDRIADAVATCVDAP